MARLLLLGLLLCCSTAFASIRLFPQPSLLTLAPSLEVVEPAPKVLVATGAAAAFFVAPAALMLGGWLGSLSNDFYGAALPALLVALLLPPLAVVFAEWLTADHAAPGRFRWLPALGAVLLTQLVMIAGAVLLGVSGVSASGAALFTLADVVALPTVATAVLHWTERPGALLVPVISGSF